jgi:hypothetical protein
MTEENTPEIKHRWWQGPWFSLIAGLLFAGYWIIVALWMVIKWSIAPIAFLVDMLILMPLGKFLVKIPVKPDIEGVEEADLPDYVWVWMEESNSCLLREGYVKGQLIKINNMGENQILYLHSLVHPEHQLGVGLGYIEMTNDTSEERHSDMNFAEFTFVCNDGKTIALSNLQKVDVLRQIPNRSRYNFSEFGVYELSLLARQVSINSGCHTNQEIQHRLANDMLQLFKEEFTMNFEHQLDRGYVKLDGESGNLKLTWKGALRSALMTLWPTCVYFKHIEENEAAAYCVFLGIDLLALLEVEACNGRASYDQTISELNDLQPLLHSLTQRVPILSGSEPISISLEYEGNGRVSGVDVNMEMRKDHPVRDYVSSSECFASFNNADLVCEYSCNSYDVFYKKEEYETLDMPQLIPPLSELLPLSQIIPIAAERIDKKAVTLSNASLQMDEQTLAWTLKFRDLVSDSYVWLTLDPHTGKVLQEEY